jgi:replicative DNA helicase
MSANVTRLRSEPVPDFSTLVNYDAEKALLGAILANNLVYDRVNEFLRPEHFADALHGRIYEAIGKLVQRGQIANPVTLKNLFDQDGALAEIGGAQYLVDLAQSVVTVLNADDYGHVVHELHRRRELVELARALAVAAAEHGRDPSETLAKAAADLSRLAGATGGGMGKLAVMQLVANYLEEPAACYSTGLPSLDDLLGGGLYAGKLYALAARKKAGKTALLGTVSEALNRTGRVHGFVALEMTPVEIEMRQVARQLKVSPVRLLRGRAAINPVDAREVIQAMTDTPDATVYLKRPGASLDELRTFILKAKHRHGAVGVIIDYLQLIGGKSRHDTEEYHLRAISQALADMTRQLGIWALVALQLNQEGNSRGGEGIKLACDAYLSLHREKDQAGAWLELEECRYAPYGTLGSDAVPGLRLNPLGPYYEEA